VRAAGTVVNSAVGVPLINSSTGTAGGAAATAAPVVRAVEVGAANQVGATLIKPTANVAAGAVPAAVAPVVRAVESVATLSVNSALIKPGAPFGAFKAKPGAAPAVTNGEPLPAAPSGKVVGSRGTGEESASGEPVDASPVLTIERLRTYDRARRKSIQVALLEIFAGDPDYIKARALPSKPLSDEVVGPITLSFITRFWMFYNADSTAVVTDNALDTMLHFADMLVKHPQMKADVLGVGFVRWIDAKPKREKYEAYRIVRTFDEQRLPGLLKRYYGSTEYMSGSDIDAEQAPLSAFWYGLSADDLKTLGAKAGMIPALTAIKDESFANRALFDAAVLAAIKLTPEQATPYMPAIARSAEGSGFQLTGKAVQNLRANMQLPRELVEAATTLRHDVYIERADMQAAIKELGDKAGAQWDAMLPAVTAEAEQVKIYTLTDAAIKTLSSDPKNAPISPVFLKIMTNLSDIQYPRRSLFDRAVIAKLRAGLGACPSGGAGARKRLLEQKIGKEDLALLKDAVGQPLAAKLDKLYEGAQCEEAETESMLATLSELYEKYKASLGEQARKQPRFNASKAIGWTGQSCGCVADQFEGQVYGFYPFWLAGSNQQINFRLVNRIGYYGVTFDEQGTMRMANDGRAMSEILATNDSAQLAFIEVARRHRTKIDWVIHKTDWDAWGNSTDLKKRQVLETLSNNIVNFLDTKLNSWRASIDPVLSFGLAGVPTRGDGITLYFDGFPRDEGSVALYSTFVEKLHARLFANGHELTIALRRGEMGKGGGIHSYDSLLSVLDKSPKRKITFRLPGTPPTAQVLPKLLVFIEEPTSVTKKQLRAEIESNYHGENRVRILRQIMPVIEFGKKDWAQLEDDMIYVGDNFGGIGFWPVTVNKVGKESAASVARASGVRSCDISKSVERCLEDFMQTKAGYSPFAFTNFICENRWILRFLVGLSLLTLVIAMAVYYQYCHLRPKLERFRYFFLALLAFAVLDTAMLIRFDPYLQHMAQGNFVPALLVLTIIGVIIYYRRKFRERDERP
jgi:hypothetical protein